jgi:hypothetical protein
MEIKLALLIVIYFMSALHFFYFVSVHIPTGSRHVRLPLNAGFFNVVTRVIHQLSSTGGLIDPNNYSMLKKVSFFLP